jgi:hypothetical protein
LGLGFGHIVRVNVFDFGVVFDLDFEKVFLVGFNLEFDLVLDGRVGIFGGGLALKVDFCMGLIWRSMVIEGESQRMFD